MSLRACILPRAAEPTRTTVAVSATPDSARASSTGFIRALSSRALVIWIHQRGDLVYEPFEVDLQSFKVCRMPTLRLPRRLLDPMLRPVDPFQLSSRARDVWFGLGNTHELVRYLFPRLGLKT